MSSNGARTGRETGRRLAGRGHGTDEVRDIPRGRRRVRRRGGLRRAAEHVARVVGLFRKKSDAREPGLLFPRGRRRGPEPRPPQLDARVRAVLLAGPLDGPKDEKRRLDVWLLLFGAPQSGSRLRGNQRGVASTPRRPEAAASRRDVPRGRSASCAAASALFRPARGLGWVPLRSLSSTRWTNG